MAVTTNAEDKIVFSGEALLSELASYDSIVCMRNEIAKNLAEELYPSIKSALLEEKNMEKIVNEVRLLIAKKSLNS